MDDFPDDHVLLAEYLAAHDSFHHYDSFRWQSGSMLIAGALVLWGFVLAGPTPAAATAGMTESIHTRKEIFHSGHPTNIQHH
jgi:hypothetical protein